MNMVLIIAFMGRENTVKKTTPLAFIVLSQMINQKFLKYSFQVFGI